jgi:outer membrane lipoprotein-sorting protein
MSDADRVRRRALALPLLALVGTVRAQPDEAQRILAASDAIRNPAQGFSADLDLVEYRQGVAVETSRLSIWAKPRAGSGQFRSLVHFGAPARERDKLMLKDGNELWFYDPRTKATVRVAPQQRLLGQASNGDVVTANLALDYRAVQVQGEDVGDGDQRLRASRRLTLEAATPEAAYRRIDLWVDAQTSGPFKARFFAESGRLLKSAFYRRYAEVLGAQRPTETIIIDGIDPRWITVLRYSNFAPKDIPEAWLQRDYLPHFVP